jgi:hypothetical protein
LSGSGPVSTRIAFLLSAALAAGCGPKPVRTAPPPTDAGQVVHDAGPLDGGPLPPQAIGGPCKEDSDCNSGHCDTQPGGGYCIEGCMDNTNCPTGSACWQIAGHDAYCLQLCSSDAQCREGYACAPGADICVPIAGCTSSGDCMSGATCNLATGLCSGALGSPGIVGAPCSDDTQCTTGPYPFCIGSDQDFSGGYCSSACNSDQQCGHNGVCVPNIVQGGPGGGTFSACFAGCNGNNDCRSKYNCLNDNNQKFCFAFCVTDMDCINTGDICNPTSGLCSSPVDAGPDAGEDAGPADAGAPDAGPPDAGEPDAGPPDAGEPDAGPADAGIYVYDGGYPAPFPTPPQVIFGGGPVLTAPKFVPIFFSNDDPTQVAAILDFDNRVGATHYWATAMSEYGVGAGMATAPVYLEDVATGTLTDGSIQGWLASMIAAGKLPAPDENTLYIIHYPEWMVITTGGERSCRAFGGYHSNFTDGNKDIIYAVLPRCTDPNSPQNTLNTETGAESHEMAEASTDPQPMTNPAYYAVDNAHIEWQLSIGGVSEVGDMCAQAPGAFTTFTELPYQVQRTWSNASITAGHDPCVPELPGEVFVNAVPEMNDAIGVNIGRGPRALANGIGLDPGDSKTVSVDLYSEADAGGPWNIRVQDLGPITGGQASFSYALDRSTGVNGDKANLTVSLSAQSASGSQDIFQIVSSRGNITIVTYGIAGH